MIPPGKRNLITDVPGLSVGQSEDHAARTGVTVVLCDAPARAAVDVRGGAPGTTGTDALDPAGLVDIVDAIALSGGSSYGLESGAGVTAWLGTRNRGFRIAPEAPPAPIVPAAIIFDLANGGDKNWGLVPPYRALAMTAAERAGAEFALGNAGAGLGAVAGIYKGGTGSASASTDGGFTVGALAIVNSVGSPIIPYTDVFWAFPFERGAEFGARRLRSDFKSVEPVFPPDMKGAVRPGANTTIAIVATDADLSRVELKRLAIMATDGLARALRPAHAPFDGDTVFALSTAHRRLGELRQISVMMLGNAAADCLARAIARGVYEAETLGDTYSYREAHGPGERA